MTNLTDNKPNAYKLLESLRSTGYDNVSAICDLIDNSFDANADLVKVEVGQGGKQDFIISIADNGDGMDEATLVQALKLGSITKRENSDLGKYGMGLITASISMARKLVVITKHQGKYLTGIHDLEDVKRKDDFVKDIRESSSTEKNFFLEHLGGTISGTIVVLQDIDNLQNKNNPAALTSSIIKKCGLTYRDFISARKVITVNRKQVLVADPMLRAYDETDELIVKEHEFVNELGERSIVRLRIYELPFLSKMANDALSKELTLNQKNQGFYLMRNNRQIAGGQRLGIFTKHNYLNRFRAEVYFDGSLDKMLGVNFKKEGSALHDEVRSWLENETIPHINAIYNRSKKKGQKDKENKTEIDHTEVEKIIRSKKSVIKLPKLSAIKNEGHAVKDIDALANVEFVDEHNTHLAPLFQSELRGEKTIIKYNLDHPFYQEVYLKEYENKNLRNAFDSFVYSVSLSLEGVIANQENRIVLKDRFLDDFSDNLRSLMT